MKYRLAFAVAALSLALVGGASAQSIYVAPGGVANIYVTPGVDGVLTAPTTVYGPGYYNGNGNGYYNGNGYGAPPLAAVPPPIAPAGVYDEPLSAYGSVPGIYMQRRILRSPDVAPRPPLPVLAPRALAPRGYVR